MYPITFLDYTGRNIIHNKSDAALSYFNVLLKQNWLFNMRKLTEHVQEWKKFKFTGGNSDRNTNCFQIIDRTFIFTFAYKYKYILFHIGNMIILFIGQTRTSFHD